MYNNYNPNYLPPHVQPIYNQPRPRKKYDPFGNPYFEYDEPISQPQYQQNQQPIPQQAQQSTKPSPPYMLVSEEQQARDYEIDINNVGVVHLFALKDDTALYAKRINPSDFSVEFAVYQKVSEANSQKKQTSAISPIDSEIVNSIDSRLKKIEQFVDNASLLFLNAGTTTQQTSVSTPDVNAEIEPPRTRRTVKKDETNSLEEN